MADLTRLDLSWLDALSTREGMYNPYTAPKARSGWARRMGRLIQRGHVSRHERNAYDALRGGLYTITPQGRAALQQGGGDA